jgi:hypothetical protein
MKKIVLLSVLFLGINGISLGNAASVQDEALAFESISGMSDSAHYFQNLQTISRWYLRAVDLLEIQSKAVSNGKKLSSDSKVMKELDSLVSASRKQVLIQLDAGGKTQNFFWKKLFLIEQHIRNQNPDAALNELSILRQFSKLF